jgi:hypothetical protein
MYVRSVGVYAPLNESKIDIIIIEMKSPKEPHIIGLRRPKRSEKKVG